VSTYFSPYPSLDLRLFLSHRFSFVNTQSGRFYFAKSTQKGHNKDMVSFDDTNRYFLQRQRMVETDLKGRDINDLRVLEAMAALPRELFVKPEYAAQAYADHPLAIGLGQTISQPYIVGLMTQCLKLTGSEIALEIGTGSGYQTAILARLCSRVYTIERFGELSARAQTVLGNLGIGNVEFFVGDGSSGWPEEGMQFDRILVTAAVPARPAPLEKQLSEGGLLAAPVGDLWNQTLEVYKKEHGRMHKTTLCGCRFVKLVGQYGFPES
jgi:protein-L-isoaspartate(D-aspartate) O-methyltransferase